MNRFIIILTLLMVCLVAMSQDRKGCLSKEQFREKQKNYIIDKAELTEEETAKFFPLYFELQDKKYSCNKKMWSKIHKTKNQDNLSDAEYNQITEDIIKTRIAVDELELEYLKKYRKVISSKKIYNIQRAEMRFSRELLKEAGKNKKR